MLKRQEVRVSGHEVQPRIVTVSLIAERLNVPVTQVREAMNRLGVEPVAYADRTACYYASTIAQVRQEISGSTDSSEASGEDV